MTGALSARPVSTTVTPSGAEPEVAVERMRHRRRDADAKQVSHQGLNTGVADHDAKRRTAVSRTGVSHWRIAGEGGMPEAPEKLTGVNGASMRTARAGTASRPCGESIWAAQCRVMMNLPDLHIAGLVAVDHDLSVPARMPPTTRWRP